MREAQDKGECRGGIVFDERVGDKNADEDGCDSCAEFGGGDVWVGVGVGGV